MKKNFNLKRYSFILFFLFFSFFLVSCEIQIIQSVSESISSETSSFDDTHIHNLKKYEKQAPTCLNTGKKEYYYCLDCNKYYEDENCLNEITTGIDSYGILELSDHNYEWVIDLSASKLTSGLKHEECSICHETRNINTIIPKITCEHSNLTKIDEIEPTCLNSGKEAYWYCLDCNKFFSNEECSDEIFDLENYGYIEALNHSFTNFIFDNDATCISDGHESAKCDRCDVIYTRILEGSKKEHDLIHYEAKPSTCIEIGWEEYDVCKNCDYTTYKELALVDHTYDETLHYDSKTHYKECIFCSKKIEVSDHVFIKNDCSICNYTLDSQGLKYIDNNDGTCNISGIGTCNDEIIYIPEEIDGLSVVAINESAFKDNKIIKEVIIPDSVTNIGSFAFFNCFSLTKVLLGNGIKELADSVFENCIVLNEISLGINITSIGSSCFKNCVLLDEIILPDAVSVLENEAFFGCKNLKNINLNNISIIGNKAFFNCSNLSDIILDNITNIGDLAFANCNSILKIELPESLKEIGNKVFENDNLFIVILRSNSLISIGENIFENCSIKIILFSFSLIPETLNDSLNKIEDCLIYQEEQWNMDENSDDIYLDWQVKTSPTCLNDGEEIRICLTDDSKSETRVILSSGHDLIHYDEKESTCIENGYYAYDVCKNCDYSTYKIKPLASHKYSDSYNYDLESHWSECIYCSTKKNIVNHKITNKKCSICDFYQGSEGLSFVSNNDGTCYVSGIGSCDDVEISIPSYSPDLLKVVAIGESAFSYCQSLISVDLPNTVNKIGRNAFRNCLNLVSISIGNNLNDIGTDAFKDCYKLIEICNKSKKSLKKESEGYGYIAYYAHNIITNEKSSLLVKKDGYIFYEGKTTYLIGSLNDDENITLPTKSPKNNNYEIYKYAFYSKENLTNLKISSGVKIIYESAFNNCSNLKTIDFANDSICKAIYEKCFANCINLESVYLPISIKSIYKWAFGGDEKLEAVYISDLSYWFSIDFYQEESNPLWYAKNLYENEKLIKNLIVPNDIKSIKNYAFYNCDSLESITFSDDSLCNSIGNYAFYNCDSLRCINIPSNVLSIGSSAFECCYYLNSVSFTEDSKCEIIYDRAFYSCSSLCSFLLPKNIKTIYYDAFTGCCRLIEIINKSTLSIDSNWWLNKSKDHNVKHFSSDISYISIKDDFVFYDDGSNVYLMNYLGNETNLTLPFKSPKNKDYEIGDYGLYVLKNVESITMYDNITSIGKFALAFNKNLKKVKLSNKITNIKSNAFAYSSSLLSIEIPSSVQKIEGSAFNYCTSLKSVVFAENSECSSIGSFVFSNCSSLRSINFNKNSKLNSIGINAFEYCGNLTSIEIPNDVSIINDETFRQCYRLRNIKLPESLTQINYQAFEDCYSLYSITLPKNLKNIERDSFVKCYKLIEVINKSNLPIFENISTYGGVSTYAHNVVNEESDSFITIKDNYVFYEGENENYLLDYIGNETNLTLPLTSPSKEKYSIHSYFLYQCLDLESITILDGVEKIFSNSFEGCSNLKSVTLPECLTYFGNYVFNNCQNLTYLNIKSLEKWCNITFNSNPLYYAKDLYINGELTNNIVIPKSVTTIKKKTFYNSNATSISFEDDSKCKTIDEFSFDNCENLTNIILPNSLTTIKTNAFYICSNLEYITFIGTINQWNNIKKEENWFYKTNISTIYCSDGIIEI